MKTPSCKKCGDTHSWHEWEQKPYCSPYCRGDFMNKYEGVKILLGKGFDKPSREREEFAGEILQPVQPDGKINPDFVKQYGTKSIQKNYHMSKREILKSADL